MKKTDRLLIVLFLTYLFSFFIMHLVFQDDSFSEEENRVLSTLDDIKFEEVLSGDTARDIEVYIQDQFPFRSLFVESKTRIDQTLNRTLINGVFINDNNTLIQQFNNFDEDTYHKNIAILNEFIVKIDLPLYLMVIPTAASINSAMLPPYSQNLEEDQLLETIKNDIDGEIFVDVNDALKEESENLYYDSDHHLNAYGSYLTYKVLMEKMNKEVYEFSFEQVSDGFSGSLSSKSGAFWVDDDVIMKPEMNEVIDYNVTYEGNEISNSVFNDENLLLKDQYTYYLDGNHAIVDIETYQDDKDNLLVLSDSYGHSLAPYLIGNFNKITFIDLRYYHRAVSELVQDYDLVLVYYGIENLINDANVTWLK